ncbi:RNA cytosine-C(5)-methyltransferase NSUN2 [Fragariocoptes setiger]|uniref:tRNA (cytosine(34)-C(5))-methyltransferase n=1 Tax=Fragariocoptes setiger TaxID=1670756 RepID=A0ABQ7S5C1_9ACAR|nr:RNA cytosine-C(5)-methyltransferase NSUN2 [Fragariocoptes setiger]
MGRFKKRNKNKQPQRENVYRQDSKEKDSVRGPYKRITKECPNFETFYKAQKLVPDSDWSVFMECLRDPLPASFRINAFCPSQAKVLRDMVESCFEDLLTTNIEAISTNEGPAETNSGACSEFIDTAKVHASFTKTALQNLDWYPDRMAWQLNYTRIDIRKSPRLRELHKLLMVETETGHISRQESVSMIPPLLIDVRSGHAVLDMCAAPGSKTAQLIEYMMNDSRLNTNRQSNIESGIVIANDVDNKRCYMLVHQSGRLNAPNCIIINQDAGKMPVLFAAKPDIELKFDRILCDVPCTGDGTIRKNLDVWMKWNVQNSHQFHGMQLKIARRGLDLLKKNGLMVYSTCSLNPSEDESVVAELLRSAKGSIELMDVSDKLEGLKYLPGLIQWTVFSRDMKPIKCPEDIPEEYVTQLKPSLFPPKPDELSQLNLNRCIRLLPHLQNTGGFFVAVFRKLTEKMPWEQEKVKTSEIEQQQSSQERKHPPKKIRMQGFKEDPFIFLSKDNEDWCRIKHAFGIDDLFPVDQLLHRCSEGKMRNIYLISRAGKQFIEANGDRDLVVKIINCGQRLFSRADKKSDAGYRMCQDGVNILLPYIKKELCVDCNRTDLTRLLLIRHSGINNFTEKTRQDLLKLPYGSFILIYKHEFDQQSSKNGEGSPVEVIDMPLVAWRGEHTVVLYVSDNYRLHLAGLLRIELPVNAKADNDTTHSTNQDVLSEPKEGVHDPSISVVDTNNI